MTSSDAPPSSTPSSNNSTKPKPNRSSLYIPNNVTTTPTSSSSNSPPLLSSPTGRTSDLDTLSKETMGLPIFVSPTGTLISTSELPSPSSSSIFDNAPRSRPSSMMAGKRLSQAIDFALATWDDLCRTAEGLIREDLPPAQFRHDDIETGGRGMAVYAEDQGREGGVDGWLD